MSEDSEKVKKLISLKAKLETRIDNLRIELDELQIMLDVVNSMLLDKGFKRPEIKKEDAKPSNAPSNEEKQVETKAEEQLDQIQPERESTTPLTAQTGETLAALHFRTGTVTVELNPDFSFNVNTPPFMSFLVERVFMKMQERDNELARAGQLIPERIFSYNIVRDGDTIREITIKNIDDDRLRELKSSIRWTLQKMHEKTRTQN